MTDRTAARALARESLERGDPLGWFEELYRRGRSDPSAVPWSETRPNPHLTRWTSSHPSPTAGSTALVVGCGYGPDAEWLGNIGYVVTAFDISPTAIGEARRRFPETVVEYRVENALELPSDWTRAFDLVFEGYTLQVLPPTIRARALTKIVECVRERLIVVARGRDVTEEAGELPWPLAREELDLVTRVRPDLLELSFDDLVDDEVPPVRRFVAAYAAR